MISKEHVLLNDLISIGIITIIEEERLEETASNFIDLLELGVVVPDKSVSISDRCSH